MKKQSAILVGLGFLLASSSVRADEYASKQRSNAAIGHYARARAMLVEALGEFEQARRYARPDMLLDPEEWRLSIISRTEELNRMLDPRPKITREGVRFQANSRLIRRERDRPPVIADGPKASNTFGEEERKQEMKAARARLDQIQAEAEDKVLAEQEAAEAPPAAKSAKGKQALDEAINSLSSIPSTDTSVKTEKLPAKKAETAPAPEVKSDAGDGSATVVETEEEEVATAPGTAEESLFGPAKEAVKAEPAEQPKAVEAEKQPGKKISLDSKPVPLTEKQEDQVSKAIDEAIKERVKTIKENGPKDATEETEDAE